MVYVRAWVLDLENSFFGNSRSPNHVASPDVHVDFDSRQIRMYYHGVVAKGIQRSRVALSENGINFEARDELLGNSYFRVFRHGGYHYAIGMPGVFYRSRDGLTRFAEGPTLFTENMRHCAVKLAGDALSVFYSNAGDCPERILVSEIDLTRTGWIGRSRRRRWCWHRRRNTRARTCRSSSRNGG